MGIGLVFDMVLAAVLGEFYEASMANAPDAARWCAVGTAAAQTTSAETVSLHPPVAEHSSVVRAACTYDEIGSLSNECIIAMSAFTADNIHWPFAGPCACTATDGTEAATTAMWAGGDPDNDPNVMSCVSQTLRPALMQTLDPTGRHVMSQNVLPSSQGQHAVAHHATCCRTCPVLESTRQSLAESSELGTPVKIGMLLVGALGTCACAFAAHQGNEENCNNNVLSYGDRDGEW